MNLLNCTVVSLVPFPIMEIKPGLIPGRFAIPESDTITPTLLSVGAGYHYVYLDETRGHLQVRDGSDEIARSIVQDYVSAQLMINEECSPGLFWVSGALKLQTILTDYADRLAEAKVKQKNWFIQLCRLADNDWNKHHQHNVVSDFQRKVAGLIGWNPSEHPWMSSVGENNVIIKKKCFGCGSMNDDDIAICPTCRCIIDPEKYKTLAFAS